MQSKFSNDTAVVAEAQKRFDAYFGGDTSVLPDDIKVPVFHIVLKNGGAKEYDALKSMHDKAQTNIEKKHVYNSIGYIADDAKKMEVLEWAISGDIKIQDFFYAVGSVSTSTKAAVPMTLRFR